MRLGNPLGHRHALDTRYRFKRAFDCDIGELDSVLDYFAPPSEQKGNWIHKPIPQDPEGFYRACYDTIQEIDPEVKLSMAQYLRRALKDDEDGSTAVVELITKFSENLEKILKQNE